MEDIQRLHDSKKHYNKITSQKEQWEVRFVKRKMGKMEGLRLTGKMIQNEQRKHGDPFAGLAFDLNIHPHLTIQRLVESPEPIGATLVVDELC